MTDIADTSWPYPSNDNPLTLPSGTTVRFYDLIVFLGSTQRSFSVHYRSELDRDDADARLVEATEVIRHFENAESCRGATKAHASICSTPAQAATKELPEEMFQFERGEAGEWRFVGKADLPAR